MAAVLVSQNCFHDIAWLFRQSVQKLLRKPIFFAISAPIVFPSGQTQKIIPDPFQSGMIFIISTGSKNHLMSKAAVRLRHKIVR
jgi:hypothetical protein